ncbi:MAG: hypothetical protein P4L99_19845 [Chthoniobacter sp.]|nr:hypothetical protein [Chthoniobacter sp.]
MKDSLSRQLLLPGSESFSDCDRHAKERKVVTPKDASESTTIEFVSDRKPSIDHCESLLTAETVEPCSDSMECVAAQIAQVANNFYRAGFNDGIRQSASFRAEKARVAKCQKANVRGRIVRQAIMAVCAQQKLTPAASDKFALSIQTDVIEIARRLGLTDVKNGTSPRSLQRHITALLKDTRML